MRRVAKKCALKGCEVMTFFRFCARCSVLVDEEKRAKRVRWIYAGETVHEAEREKETGSAVRR